MTLARDQRRLHDLVQSLRPHAAKDAVSAIKLAALLQRRRDVIAIDLAASPVAKGRAHAVAVRVVDKPLERQIRRPQRSIPVGHDVGFQPLLDRLEQICVDDGRMTPRHGGVAVDDLTEIDAVLEQVEQGPAAVGDAAGAVALAADPHSGQPALGLEVLRQGRH